MFCGAKLNYLINIIRKITKYIESTQHAATNQIESEREKRYERKRESERDGSRSVCINCCFLTETFAQT